MIAAIELHSLHDLEHGLGRLRLLDRDDAFVADLLHRVGDQLADGRIVMGGDRRHLGLLLRVATGRDSSFRASIGRLAAAVEAALEVDGARARDHVAHAVGEHRMGQDGRRAVPSPTMSPVFSAACRSICAPRFSSGSFSSNSLAMVTPSLQTSGAPHFFWISTDFDLGPSVTRTASASWVAPRRTFSRAAERNRTCLKAIDEILPTAESRHSTQQCRCHGGTHPVCYIDKDHPGPDWRLVQTPAPGLRASGILGYPTCLQRPVVQTDVGQCGTAVTASLKPN